MEVSDRRAGHLILLNRQPNWLEVIPRLLHVPLATSLEWFDELLSAVLHDLDVGVSDGIVLSFYIVLGDIADGFVIGLLQRLFIVFAQYFIAMLFILLDDKPEVLDLPFDSQLLLLILWGGLSWSLLGFSLLLALRRLELPPSRSLIGFIWLIILRVLFAIYFYTTLVSINDWVCRTIQMNSSDTFSLLLQDHFIFSECRAENLRWRQTPGPCQMIVFLLISNAS